jgi:hypothetical protein
MPKFQLSETVLPILRAHGWHEERQVDVGEIVAFLKNNGIDPSPTATAFLQAFNGLRLQLPNGGLSAVAFDVFEEMQFLEVGELVELESLVNQSLCPVGLGGRFLLFIASSGEVVFLHDEWLMYLRAKNFTDAFEVICVPEFKDYETVMLADHQKPAAFRDVG